MVANARRIPIALLLAAALVAASVTTWASHALIQRRVDWDEIRKEPHRVFLVYLNELVGLPQCPGGAFSPAEYPGPAAQAYFQNILQEAQPYYQPPARLIEIWTQSNVQGAYRQGWPFTTYQRVSVVEVEVITPPTRHEGREFYVDTDGRKPHTNYAAMAGNFAVHFAGWLLLLLLLAHVIRFIRSRLRTTHHAFPVIVRRDEAQTP